MARESFMIRTIHKWIL